MADLNKVFLMGRLTFDPELRRTPSQVAVSKLQLATTRTWQGRDGERREETLYIEVVVWDRQAEACCQYLRKGSAVHVEGSLKLETWDDKTTGDKRTKISVHGDRVQFLDSRKTAGGGDPDEAYGGGRESAPRARPAGGTGAAPSRPAPAADARPSNGAARPSPNPAPSAEPPRSAMDLDDVGDDDIPF